MRHRRVPCRPPLFLSLDVELLGEHEELLRAATETQTSNPFEKVVQLIGGATDSGDGSDLQIMRSLLVRLKNDPKRSSEPKDDAEPAEAADPFASM